MYKSAGLLLLSLFIVAGDPDSPAPPNDPSSAMFTLEDIYFRLANGTAGVKRGDVFNEPSRWSATGTMFTLNQIMEVAPVADDTNGATAEQVLWGKTFWSLRTDGTWGLQIGTKALVGVEKTGQTISHSPGDDGAAQAGVQWASPRFTDNGDGTVTDNNTGLTWLLDASCSNTMLWEEALAFCASLGNGQCNLTDGSSAGDWRLPNIKELESLVDFGYSNPALSDAAGTGQWQEGNVFSGVVSSYYWSSTTIAAFPDFAWGVRLNLGYVDYGYKSLGKANVWPVRRY